MSLLKCYQKRIFLGNYIIMGFMQLPWFQISFGSLSCCHVPVHVTSQLWSFAFHQLDTPHWVSAEPGTFPVPSPTFFPYLLAGCQEIDWGYYSAPKVLRNSRVNGTLWDQPLTLRMSISLPRFDFPALLLSPPAQDQKFLKERQEKKRKELRERERDNCLYFFLKKNKNKTLLYFLLVLLQNFFYI